MWKTHRMGHIEALESKKRNFETDFPYFQQNGYMAQMGLQRAFQGV